MIPQIAAAMSKGFSSSQVVKFLLRKYPGHKDAIEKALAAGFTTDQVIRFLSKNSGKKLEEPTGSQIDTDYSQMQNIDNSRRQRDENIALKTGAAAIGAPLALNAVGSMMQPGQAMAMQHAMPSTPTTLLGSTPQKLLPTQPSIPPVNAPPPQSPMGGAGAVNPMPTNKTPTIPQPQQSLQPIQPQRDVKKSVDIIKSTGHEITVKNLLEGGLSPTDIKDTLGQIMGKQKLKELEKITGGVEQAIEDYAQAIQNQSQEQPKMESASQQLDATQSQAQGVSAEMMQGLEPQAKVSTTVPTEKNEDMHLEKYKPTGRDYTISKEYIGKWYSSKPGQFIGNLKDFFTGEKLREKFKDVLDVKVYKGSPKYRTKAGNEADAGYGENKILLNSFDDNNIFPLLIEEASHALQDRKGRLTEDSESDYETNINEVSAKKHVDYLNKFHEKEKSKLAKEEDERTQERIRKAIAKHETVSTPQGIGEVKEIRNGKAIVEVDGKLHKVDEAEIEKTLFTDDDIANKYEELMAAIPEEHRSGFISWAGYDEDTNEIGFIPRGGKYEVLTNITPEEAKRIKEGKGVARTTGENKEGIWVQGEDTRGGVISQIIHDRRKANKKESDKQLNLFDSPKREKEDKGMKPLFDEMAYARSKSQEREKKKALAAREQKKREKEAEKEQIKRDKDESKKRKK